MIWYWFLGYVVTVEPGIYFIRPLLYPIQRTEAHSFIDYHMLERFMDLGGVRIEDDVVVTKDGYHNLTTVPKEITDLERLMA
jgi:Xaa-Pro dipeptidase